MEEIRLRVVTVEPLGALLAKHQIQQKDLAQAIGVSVQSLGNWIHGRSVPSTSRLVHLLDFLRTFEPELRLEDLVGGNGS